MNKKDWLWLLILLLLAGALRIVGLSHLPLGFHNDEAMNGYVGRFILANGKDLYGNPWPLLYFNNIGDYPNVLPMYLSGLSTYIFGVNEFAVRMPIALIGTLTVGLIYLICRWFFKERKVAIVAAILLALLPWHIVLSRATAEGITASFVFLLGYFLLIGAMQNQKILRVVLGSLLVMSTSLLYPGFRILMSISLLPLLFMSWKSKMRWPFLVVTIVSLCLTLYISQTVWGKARFGQTSVFNYANTIAERSKSYSTGLGPNQVIRARLFHNKAVLASREIARQYLSYFGPDFWIGSGGKPLRYDVIEHGTGFYVIVLIMIIAVLMQYINPVDKKQIVALFKNNRQLYFLSLLWIVFITPLPAALTLEDVPNVHRTVLLGIVATIMVSAALAIVLIKARKNWRRLAMTIFGLMLIVESIYFWHFYQGLSGPDTAFARTDEQRNLAVWLIANRQRFSQVYVPAREATAIQYLFQTKNFDKSLVGKFQESMLIDQVDNITFLPDPCISKRPDLVMPTDSSIALVLRSACDVPENYIKEGEIKYSNGLGAYTIYLPMVKSTK